MNRIPLARQLQAAAQAVLEVTRGRSLDTPLATLAPELRPGVQAIAFHVLRELGLARELARELVKKPPRDEVQALLWTGLALAQTAGGSEANAAPADDAPVYAPHVLVSQLVQAAKDDRHTHVFAPLINGVLRRFARERDALLTQARRQPEARWNFPAWWLQRVRTDWPDAWEALLAALQERAPLTLRVNARWGTPAKAVAVLAEAGIAAQAMGGWAVQLAAPLPVARIPGFDAGRYSVQDASAQLAAPLLLDAGMLARASVQRPLAVLDACAAPGGKTAHLLELAPPGAIHVLALDADARRLERVRDTLARIGLEAELRAADAGAPEAFAAGETFDAILLDAPCSASGIVRRHPDVRWLRRASDIAALAAQQARLLDALWPRLRAGGRLLYCTCSIFRAEGEDQAQAFLSRHTDAHRLPAPGHLLPGRVAVADAPSRQWTHPLPQGGDGFYYALFEK